VYARDIAGRELTFGVSGKLIMNALVMYDHQTDTLWSHFLGQAVEGELKGQQLEFIPAVQTTWGAWKKVHPDTLLLSTGRFRFDSYVRYYDDPNAPGIIGETFSDDRLGRKDLVLGLLMAGEAKAYPFKELAFQPVLNDQAGDIPVLIVFDILTHFAATYSRRLDDRELSFVEIENPEHGEVRMWDEQTASLWDGLTGESLEGPLAGERLQQLPSNYSFWFAWKDYHPETLLFGEGAAAPAS
jgi:hypothetical protein